MAQRRRMLPLRRRLATPSKRLIHKRQNAGTPAEDSAGISDGTPMLGAATAVGGAAINEGPAIVGQTTEADAAAARASALLCALHRVMNASSKDRRSGD